MAGKNSNSKSDYSVVDRMLHRMAFAHPLLQRALGEIESDIFAAKFESIRPEKPVFVTGLPRAGTTLLLELLYKTGEFATFTYREMPFVLAPLFWASMTKSSRKAGDARERAHGDGMEISFDSPEAFEEVLWLSYLRDAYVKDDRLIPLGAEAVTGEFRDAFVKLVRKLSALQSVGGDARRYLSKNNANIGRIGALRSIFPDATIFVCLREPQSHVRSLMTQHRRFLSMHDDDPFARDYMKWIGHYDFGANFRPIDFAGRGLTAADAASPDFWLRYWIDAYAFAEKKAADVKFVCYEKLLTDAPTALAGIATTAGLKSPEAFKANAASVRRPTTEEAPLDGADRRLIEEAFDLYRRLAAKSLG
jgi:hypothetical protein